MSELMGSSVLAHSMQAPGGSFRPMMRDELDLSFERLAKLVHDLGHAGSNVPRKDIVARYFASLAWPAPPGTGKVLFRLLYPHFSPRRRYDMQESSLARKLVSIWRLGGSNKDRIERWNEAAHVERGQLGRSGCLGLEVKRVAETLNAFRESQASIHDVDQLLDELARHSPFSNIDGPSPDPLLSQDELLARLYSKSNMSPIALAFLTQVILRDLRPLVVPLSDRSYHYTTALLAHAAEVPQSVDVWQAMSLWHPQMRQMHRSVGDVDRVCDMLEQDNDLNSPRSCRKRFRERSDSGVGSVLGGMNVRPLLAAELIMGVNIEIPKCEKGRSVRSALEVIVGKSSRPRSQSVWAETKYDGYRMQMHIWRDSHDTQQVRIFSKSKRDSTWDRRETHDIILASLGWPLKGSNGSNHTLHERTRDRSGTDKSSVTNVILEGELLPYNEGQRAGDRGPGIEDFWHMDYKSSPLEHYCIAFFDVLRYDGKELLSSPYTLRRQLLEKIVIPIEGYAFLAERHEVRLSEGFEQAAATLSGLYERSRHERLEGLVLKASESRYNDPYLRWVKLKADYIPGHGDVVDLPVIAAGWDKDRARELRVGTSVLTTFYVGTCTNKKAVEARQEAPHFDLLFTVSYGMARADLERLNAEIQLNPANRPFSRTDHFRLLSGLSYSFSMPPSMQSPLVFLAMPMLFEVMGAGFQKIPGSKNFGLRWPRVQKRYARTERVWTEGLDREAYLRVCEAALGREDIDEMQPSQAASPKPGEDTRSLWASSAAGGLDVPDWSPQTAGDAKRAGVKSEWISPQKKGSEFANSVADRIPLEPLVHISSRKRDHNTPSEACPIFLPKRFDVVNHRFQPLPSKMLASRKLCTSLDRFLDSVGWTARSKLRPAKHGILYVNKADRKGVVDLKRYLKVRMPEQAWAGRITIVDIDTLYMTARLPADLVQSLWV